MAEGAEPALYQDQAPLPPPPPPKALAEASKFIHRAIDTGIVQETDKVALDALVIAKRLVQNILHNPTQEKYKKFKDQNPKIKKELISLPGGRALLQAIGFGTQVMDFQEMWVLQETEDTPAILKVALEAIERYESSVRLRVEKARVKRSELLSGMSAEREAILAQIEMDKEDRRDRAQFRDMSSVVAVENTEST